jgi:hypothetical protein
VCDRSLAEFNNCDFPDAVTTSIIAISNSHVAIQHCTFLGAERFSVYLYDGSTGTIIGSTFGLQTGKGVLLLKGSQCYVRDNIFENCQAGGVTVAGQSKIYAERCRFEHLASSAIDVIGGSEARILDCYVEDCIGNAVKFDSSSGFVVRSTFRELVYPAVAIFGIASNPVIHDCSIIDSCKAAICCRDACVPIFSNICVRGAVLHGFAISDFAAPYITGCSISDIAGDSFNVTNGATPTIVRNTILVTGRALSVITCGNPIFRENAFIGEPDTFDFAVHAFGIISPDTFTGNIFRHSESLVHIPLRLNADQNWLEFGEFDAESSIGYEEDRTVCNERESPILHTIAPLPALITPYTTVPAEPLNTAIPTLPWTDNIPLPMRVRTPESIKTAHCSRSHKSPGLCMECGVRPARILIPACGHRILCTLCGARINEALKTAPLLSITCKLCGRPITSLRVACDADTVLLPCWHGTSSWAEAVKLQREQLNCPSCQAKVTGYLHQFPIYEGDAEIVSRVSGRIGIGDTPFWIAEAGGGDQ